MKKQITLGIIMIALIALATTCWCNHLDAKIADAKARYEQDMQAVENLKKELASIDAAGAYYEHLAEELTKENRKVHELNRQREERIKAIETKLEKAKEREQLLVNARHINLEADKKHTIKIPEETLKEIRKQQLEIQARIDRDLAKQAHEIQNSLIKAEWRLRLRQAEKKNSGGKSGVLL